MESKCSLKLPIIIDKIELENGIIFIRAPEARKCLFGKTIKIQSRVSFSWKHLVSLCMWFFSKVREASRRLASLSHLRIEKLLQDVVCLSFCTLYFSSVIEMRIDSNRIKHFATFFFIDSIFRVFFSEFSWLYRLFRVPKYSEFRAIHPEKITMNIIY